MKRKMSFQIFFILTVISLFFLHESIALPTIPQPDSSSSSSPIQSFKPTQTLPTTIPAFPEQSNIAGCPLKLPEELFTSINQACNSNKGKDNHHHYLSKSKCCPVLAAWLYSAYSDTALNRATRMRMSTTSSHDPLPILPDDSEPCVDNLEKALKSKGIELIKPNQTCDLVFCYCGIRLPPLSCTEAFSTSSSSSTNGVTKLVGDKSVQKLEKDCLNHNNGAGGGYSSSHSGCSKCLNSLYKLNGDKQHVNKTDSKSKMHGRGCELMGLTWLLGKNRTAYMPTVTSVLRALMMNKDDLEPKSCSVTSEGLPLAVDSAELNDQSSSSIDVKSPVINLLVIVSMSFVYVLSLLF